MPEMMVVPLYGTVMPCLRQAIGQSVAMLLIPPLKKKTYQIPTLYQTPFYKKMF